MSISLSKIEQFLEPTKERGGKVGLFFGTVLGSNGSQLVIEGKSGGVVYATSYVYCDVGDLVSCLTDGTTIIAFAAKDAQRVADDLTKIGMVYFAGDGITIDDGNRINADVTSSDIETLSTQIAGKASISHEHTVSDITDFPESMPASDVSSWAKASSKPTYTYSEVGAAASDHNHEISDVNGLQDSLNSKASSEHEHSADDVSSGVLSLDRIPTIPVSKISGLSQDGSFDPPQKMVLLSAGDEFNPAEVYGGTWKLETETYLFLGIRIYTRIS